MKKLLVFDLDGTLIDSAPDICISVNKLLSKYGKAELDHPHIVAHIGEGLIKLMTDFFPEHSNNSEKLLKIADEFMEIYEKDMFNNTKIFDGVVDFLSTWQGKIGIITNKSSAPTKAILQHLNLHNFPWVEVYAADSLPERKPSPLPLLTMMSKAKVTANETLMIGDGTPDMASARAANVDALAIGFGYTQVQILKKYQPIHVLEHYRLLLPFLHSLSPRKD